MGNVGCLNAGEFASHPRLFPSGAKRERTRLMMLLPFAHVSKRHTRGSRVFARLRVACELPEHAGWLLPAVAR